MNKITGKHILCGVQPTGKLHLGNYLGTLKDALELQKNNRVTFLVAQLHAMTTGDISVDKLVEQTMLELTRLGAEEIITQSKDNTLLMWELACQCSTGDLFRMTQYKDKKEKMPNCGILIYPLLMAADIILIDPDYVLTGVDQKQHLELTAKLCRKTGRRVPEMLQSSAPKIMSVYNPDRKMSKSSEDKNCVYLSDTPEIIRLKFRHAPTTVQGLKSLRTMCKALDVEYIPSDCKTMKEWLAEAVINIMHN